MNTDQTVIGVLEQLSLPRQKLVVRFMLELCRLEEYERKEEHERVSPAPSGTPDQS